MEYMLVSTEKYIFQSRNPGIRDPGITIPTSIDRLDHNAFSCRYILAQVSTSNWKNVRPLPASRKHLPTAPDSVRRTLSVFTSTKSCRFPRGCAIPNAPVAGFCQRKGANNV